jgi:hypothetical protein
MYLRLIVFILSALAVASLFAYNHSFHTQTAEVAGKFLSEVRPQSSSKLAFQETPSKRCPNRRPNCVRR